MLISCYNLRLDKIILHLIEHIYYDGNVKCITLNHDAILLMIESRTCAYE